MYKYECNARYDSFSDIKEFTTEMLLPGQEVTQRCGFRSQARPGLTLLHSAFSSSFRSSSGPLTLGPPSKHLQPSKYEVKTRMLENENFNVFTSELLAVTFASKYDDKLTLIYFLSGHPEL